MIKYGLFFIVILAAGCTSMDVRPIPAAAKLDKVCIKFNDDGKRPPKAALMG